MTDPDPADLVADLDARARRFETPCGAGRLVWRAWGSGPPVLLAHGSHGAWSHWIRNIEALAAAGRTVWAPDLPGYGESANAERDDPAAIADALASGLRQLGIGTPLDVVGFSFGGVMSAWLAARRPALVRRLVIAGSGGLGTPVGDIALTRVRGLEGEARRAALKANLLGLMLHAADSADDLALHLQATNGRLARLDPAPLVLPDRLVEALPQIHAQIDAIWGEHDRPHPIAAGQEAVLRRFEPDLEFHVIPAAGHWAMYEQPGAFNQVLVEMLARPLRPKR